MLIDVSFFLSGPRHIANATLAELPSQDSIAVNDMIVAYIKEYQSQFLSGMLGSKLSREVTDYLELIEQEEEETEENKNEESASVSESKYESLCKRIRDSYANYVFFHILRDANTQATIKGLVRLKSDNTYVSPFQRQVSTWNDMVKKNREFVRWASSKDCPFTVSIDSNLLIPINTFNL